MARKPLRPHNFRALSKPKPIKKNEHRHYLPYIPLVLLVLSTFLVSLAQPIQRHGVLAYATSMSQDGLLDATNQQRINNAVGALALSQTLSAAAQAKANDMIARNYWSHNTPDGQEPWVFFNNVGYKFSKAGENLAYGFLTSSETVTGWMNSQAHKDNLLDPVFTEVGFGFANGENFNSSGPETVVVAMYAKPQVLAAEQQAAPIAAAPTPAPTITAVPPPTPAPVETTTPEPVEPSPTAPITSDQPTIKEPETKEITRVQSLTGGNAPWTLFGTGAITGIAIVVLLLKHATGLRHLIKDSERFILHHPMLDSILISLVLFGSFMSQTTGFIR